MAASMRLNEAIEEYLESRKARGLKDSQSTRSALISFMAAIGNIYTKSLGTHHVDMWFISKPTWQQSTRSIMVARLSGFQKWLWSRKLLGRDVDMLEERRRIKVPKKRRQRIPLAQFPEILDRATAPRDRIIVAIGLFLLVRASEMITIRWGDVHDEHVAVYRTKPGNYDDLPIGPDLADELALWRREVCIQQGVTAPDPNWYVVCAMHRSEDRDDRGHFAASTGHMPLLPHLPLKHPRERLKKIMAQIGVNEPGTGMHTLRRSGAQALLESMIASGEGKDQALLVVSSMLGHADVKTTQIYLDYEANRVTRDKLVKGRRMIAPDTGGDVIELKRAR